MALAPIVPINELTRSAGQPSKNPQVVSVLGSGSIGVGLRGLTIPKPS